MKNIQLKIKKIYYSMSHSNRISKLKRKMKNRVVMWFIKKTKIFKIYTSFKDLSKLLLMLKRR